MSTSRDRKFVRLMPGRILPGDWNTEAFKPRHAPRGRGRRLVAGGVPLLLIFILGLPAAKAQDQRKRKVPLVDKLSGGSKLAFSGKVEAVDLKLHVLELNAKESKSLEIFPIKSGISVTAANGDRMKLSELKPGNQVIVYYEQKGGRRTVKDIVLLTEGTGEKTEKSAPPT